MRIWARKSLTASVNAPEFFKVTMAGIEYYTEFFGQPFPFSKYDQVFAPEFNAGAMENVGCVTYNEGYLFRGQEPTRSQMESFSITILHELAHQWFGNLVTMRWWDDLWLNESFATYMSTLAQQYGRGLDDYTMGWIEFGRDKNWGMNTDLLSTTHPISTDCKHTDDAENIFDGISYGRGASFLKLLSFMIGEDSLAAGMKIYFKRHAWGNTELPDFVRALQEGYDSLGKTGLALSQFCDIWLMTSGINVFTPEVEWEDGRVKSLRIHQTLEKHGENCLRP